MLRHCRILVVDDDPDIREAIAEVLRMEGATVLTASSGPEALETLSVIRPSLVLLDLMMPGMTGWDVFERMRERPALAKVPVCIISAVANRAPPAVDRVLVKPIAIDDLLKTVKDFC